jgi:predicted XRE-type DNA-binding protein
MAKKKNKIKNKGVGISGGGESIDRTKNRSDHYQPIICEAPCSNEMMAEVADGAGISSQLNPFGYNEELAELKDQLKIAMWRLINEELTDRQAEVIQLSASGKTQQEIAKLLGINQSSITKSIRGNCDYRNGRKVYGGAAKKLKKLADKDDEINEILNRISDIEGNIF